MAKDKLSACHNASISERKGVDTCDVCHKPCGAGKAKDSDEPVAVSESMKRDELEKVATDEGVEASKIDDAGTKADLVALIEENRAAKA